MSKKIGVYICECGTNISDRIDIDSLIEEISSLEDVGVAKKYGLLCSPAGKKYLAEDIKKEELTHLVIGACSPREHEQTFMKVCLEAGLNPYLFQMVNIREQCAWMISDKEAATRLAIKYIRAGIKRVALHKSLEKIELESNPDVLVIGGGIAGIEASLSLAGPERKIYLVEKTDALGGMTNKFAQLLPHQGANLSIVKDKIEQVNNNEHIEVFTSTAVEDIHGFLGNFEISVTNQEKDSEKKEFKAGAVVVAIGFGLYDPKETPAFGYGDVENVINALEFETMISSGKIVLKNGKPPASVALIHCVGRKEKGYCSKTCCLYSIKFARYLKDKLPNVDVSEFYQDLCLPDKSDQNYFEEAKKKGIHFIQSDEIEIKDINDRIKVKYKSAEGKKEELSVDMAILAPAMVPSQDTPKMAEMLNLPLDETGFFKEAHEMLNPVATPIEGVFVVGCALGPKNIPDSIVQSQAAAGKILSTLIPGKKLEPEVKTAEIREEFCTGCQTCLSVCFYGVISFDEHKGISIVNEAICRGCGSCVGSCPSGAIKIKHFTYPQLYREVLEALR